MDLKENKMFGLMSKYLKRGICHKVLVAHFTWHHQDLAECANVIQACKTEGAKMIQADGAKMISHARPSKQKGWCNTICHLLCANPSSNAARTAQGLECQCGNKPTKSSEPQCPRTSECDLWDALPLQVRTMSYHSHAQGPIPWGHPLKAKGRQ